MDPALRTLAPLVDAAYYLAGNPDVRAAGMAPAEHYWRMGWREGRDPSPWFATDYYVRANPDVRVAGINPLWHYAVRGRAEGRPPRPPGGAWREELDRPPAIAAPIPAATLPRQRLHRLLRRACEDARGLVLSISHDRYTEHRGGTQLLIADEQRKFNGDRAAYLHLSPLTPRLGLADAAPARCGVVLDGVWRGAARLADLGAALAAVPERLRRLLVVHALHGWRPEDVAALAAALRPAHAVFWAHDYGAACPSPRLLRNDIAFCAAPPADSPGCRICAPGAARPAHVARLTALFRAVPFHLAAPSRRAAETWRRAVALPVQSVQVHPHASLHPLPAAPAEAAAPIRIGFVGHAAFHKGWPAFRDLLGRLRGRPDYAFFHLASRDALQAMDGLTPIAAASTPADPHGMRRALEAARIDLVLAPSPWPETFGYVAHEALAAGADIVTLAGSGAVADLVTRFGRGAVLADAAALAAFFDGPAEAALVRRRRSTGRPVLRLLHDGATATLALSGGAVTTDDPDLHLWSAGGRIDGATDGWTWRFALPPVARLRLRSRVLHPAWQDLAGQDLAGQDLAWPDGPSGAARIGVAVAELRLDGRLLAPRWRCTDGDTPLATRGAARLEVRLAARLRYWCAPLLA